MAIKFDQLGIFDLLRFTMSMTTDEKVMVRTWRVFREQTQGPLFAVKLLDPAKRRAQFNFNRFAIEALRDLHTSIADICRLTELHRSTVEKHSRRWSEMTEAEREKRRHERVRLLDYADEQRINLMLQHRHDMAAAAKLKAEMERGEFETFGGWEGDDG